MMTTTNRRLLCLQLLAAAGLLFSLLKGSTPTSLHQLLYNENSEFHTVFMQLRLPRTLTAFTSGGLLALSGALIQLLLQKSTRRSLCSGHFQRCGIFYLAVNADGRERRLVAHGAWLGSLLTAAVMLLLAKRHGWQIHSLLLSGMAIASGFTAGISLILLISPDASLHSMLFWLMVI